MYENNEPCDTDKIISPWMLNIYHTHRQTDRQITRLIMKYNFHFVVKVNKQQVLIQN